MQTTAATVVNSDRDEDVRSVIDTATAADTSVAHSFLRQGRIKT